MYLFSMSAYLILNLFFAVDSLAMELTEIVNEAGLSLEDLIQELQVEVRYAGLEVSKT